MTDGVLGGDGASPDLGAAQAAIGEALGGLAQAAALPWDSPAGVAFRARLGDLVAGVRRRGRDVDEMRVAAVRLAHRGAAAS
ncbi:MAG: hypothetical protein FWF90_01075 [Promicromonosporaceae bacterium]|nr:hypothetical protein [Promicromonosporaceae bacterium]